MFKRTKLNNLVHYNKNRTVIIEWSKIYNREKKHFTQFGGCYSDHSGWTVQDTHFQLQAQNRSANKTKASVHGIMGASKWYSKASPGSCPRK